MMSQLGANGRSVSTPSHNLGLPIYSGVRHTHAHTSSIPTPSLNQRSNCIRSLTIQHRTNCTCAIDLSSDTEITEWTDGLVNPGENEGNLVSEIMRYKPWNEGAASVSERHDGPPGEVSGSEGGGGKRSRNPPRFRPRQHRLRLMATALHSSCVHLPSLFEGPVERPNGFGWVS